MRTDAGRRLVALLTASAFLTGTGAVVSLALAGTVELWVAAAVVLTVAMALFVPVRGRVLLWRRVSVAATFLWRRRRPVRCDVPPAVPVTVFSGDAGVRWDGDTLVAAIEVCPDPALTRDADGRAVTTAELSLASVAALRDQYGLRVGIDVVSSGRHVPPGTAYRTVYAQAVGPRPLVGQRRTWLVLRLDARRDLAGIVERGPSRTAAPRALAAAAHRVVQRLAQQRVRAYACSAEELDALHAELLVPLRGDARERWSSVLSSAGVTTTYVGDPACLADGGWDRWWSWRTEDTVVVLRLDGEGRDGARVGVLVRHVHRGVAVVKPLSAARLRLPTGRQRRLVDALAPAGDRSLRARMPTVALGDVSTVAVAHGPSGQLLGLTEDGEPVTVALWDQTDRPLRRRVDAAVSGDLAKQVVLRAVVTGAVVALHTDDRSRWDPLIAVVGDPARLFHATAGARPSDIAVFDGRPVGPAPTRTVLQFHADGLPERAAAGADIALEEVGGRLLVTVGAAAPVELHPVRPREEDRYLGLDILSAPPRRTVTVEPSLTRAARGSGVAVAAPAAGGARRSGDRDLAGPRRAPRPATERSVPDTTPARVRRDYGLPPR